MPVRFLQVLSVVAGILDIYYLVSWTIVFNRYESQEKRLAYFETLFLGLDITMIHLAIFILNVIICIWLITKKLNFLSGVALLFYSLCALLFLWAML